MVFSLTLLKNAILLSRAGWGIFHLKPQMGEGAMVSSRYKNPPSNAFFAFEEGRTSGAGLGWG